MPTDVTRAEVVRLLEKGAQLVEVLPRDEYEDEHLPGAISLPLKELNRTTAAVLDRGAGKSDWAASGLELEGALTEIPTARDAADRETPTCRLDEPLADVRERVATVGWSACVVVDERRVVLGLLNRAALSGSTAETVEDAMTEGPSTVRPNVPLEELTRRMEERGLEQIVVTTSNGRLVGVVRRATGG